MRLMRRLCWLLLAALATLLALSLLVARRRVAAEEGTAGSRDDGQPPQTAQSPQPPPAVLTSLEHLPATCPGRAPCISFGTPYFSEWSGWMPYVRQWLGTAQAACGVACDVVSKPGQADALLFHGRDLHLIPQGLARGARQHWVYMNMESPLATKKYGYDVSSDPRFLHMFNWTATTMLTSSVHLPYGIWDQRKEPIQGPFYSPQKKRHMAYVAFSNCNNAFNNRTTKVNELKRYMDVHVYGSCGNRPLPKDWNVWRQISETYRFYLSFENAFCRDYITEKYHNNGLDSQAIPVVFGGLSRADYERVSPPRSFVYALDFASMRQLADHLKSLAADEDRYATYFEWKRSFSVSPRTALLCGVCTRLHKDRSPVVEDLSNFYDTERNCQPGSYQYLI